MSDGNEVQILSTQGDVRETGWVSASFSPDSKYGVYNLNKQLWILDAETGEKTQLTTELREYREPRWSTDGNKIIYTTGEEVRLIKLTF
ncbi:MAG: PD40 domain-containing protein [Parcubacteria group bacterium]|nr:PD40 domain-containing protein [Parcubacteria group bacterium]